MDGALVLHVTVWPERMTPEASFTVALSVCELPTEIEAESGVTVTDAGEPGGVTLALAVDAEATFESAPVTLAPAVVRYASIRKS